MVDFYSLFAPTTFSICGRNRRRGDTHPFLPYIIEEPADSPDIVPSDTRDAATLLTERDAAREAGVSTKTIRRLIQRGRLEAIDYGNGSRHTYRIKLGALAALKQQPGKVEAPAHRRRIRRRAASVLPAGSGLPVVSSEAVATGRVKRPLTHA
jgi:Helix-turn-helix domain